MLGIKIRSCIKLLRMSGDDCWEILGSSEGDEGAVRNWQGVNFCNSERRLRIANPLCRVFCWPMFLVVRMSW